MARPTRKGGWHAEDIKAAIRKRGTTLSALATQAELHESTVRNALYRPIPAAADVIAGFLGLPKHALWPDWFDAEGHRIYHRNRSRSRLNSRRGRPRSHRESTVAA